ncbi:MAG: Glutaconyl-CoA decarboxylase subunit gamma [Owenweeksia sp. TMED14]|nr:MAG: Glutaconyl-CoA decarboxylase subunit gamma [Owenweeksia sp. TMED14]|tara:strand:- start:4025 stop:4498 length:474 start_codon:yes stop_codon:yes gene_type:complete
MKHFVNQKETIEFNLDDKLEIEQLNSREYRIRIGSKVFRAHMISSNTKEKNSSWWIDGSTYSVSSKTDLDELIRKLGMEENNQRGVNQITAPMPGLVLDVKCSKGDSVNKGDNLIVLEAMKMENIIKSPVDGIINSVSIKKGQTVEKNTLLISFKQD